MSCVFCDDPAIQGRMIFKDALLMIFPTNIPITPGHVLVCPTRHVATIDDLTSAELEAMQKSVVRLKNVLKCEVGAEGFNIAWNEGEVAGQSVEHFHVHVVPRKKDDTGIYEYEPRKFLYRPGSRAVSSEAELQEVAAILKKDFIQL